MPKALDRPRKIVIASTATGIDADTVIPTLRNRYSDEAPKTIPSSEPRTTADNGQLGQLGLVRDVRLKRVFAVDCGADMSLGDSVEEQERRHVASTAPSGDPGLFESPSQVDLTPGRLIAARRLAMSQSTSIIRRPASTSKISSLG